MSSQLQICQVGDLRRERVTRPPLEQQKCDELEQQKCDELAQQLAEMEELQEHNKHLQEQLDAADEQIVAIAEMLGEGAVWSWALFEGSEFLRERVNNLTGFKSWEVLNAYYDMLN